LLILLVPDFHKRETFFNKLLTAEDAEDAEDIKESSRDSRITIHDPFEPPRRQEKQKQNCPLRILYAAQNKIGGANPAPPTRHE